MPQCNLVTVFLTDLSLSELATASILPSSLFHMASVEGAYMNLMAAFGPSLSGLSTSEVLIPGTFQRANLL